MGIIKTFSEYINESAISVKNLTDNVYQALIDYGLGDNFIEPQYDTESPFLTAQADTYGFEITDEVDAIGFKEGSMYDYDNYIFYTIYITDEAPINDDGETASIFIEYGEDDYTDGPEPWCLYYSAATDKWLSDENNLKNPNANLAKLLGVLAKAINPGTRYRTESWRRSI